MNKNKKLIIVIISVVSSVLAGIIIFSTIFFHFKKKRDLKKQNDLQQEIATLKKEKDQLLAQVSQIDWQTYKGDFYDEATQKQFQQQKIQLQQEIKKDLNTDCNQTALEDQKECWLNFNHQLSQTVNNFNKFNNDYQYNLREFDKNLTTAQNNFQQQSSQLKKAQQQFNGQDDSFYHITDYQNDYQIPTNFAQQKAQLNANTATLTNDTCQSKTTKFQQYTCYQELNSKVIDTQKALAQLKTNFAADLQTAKTKIAQKKQELDNFTTTFHSFQENDFLTFIQTVMPKLTLKYPKFDTSSCQKQPTWQKKYHCLFNLYNSVKESINNIDQFKLNDYQASYQTYLNNKEKILNKAFNFQKVLDYSDKVAQFNQTVTGIIKGFKFKMAKEKALVLQDVFVQINNWFNNITVTTEQIKQTFEKGSYQEFVGNTTKLYQKSSLQFETTLSHYYQALIKYHDQQLIVINELNQFLTFFNQIYKLINIEILLSDMNTIIHSSSLATFNQQQAALINKVNVWLTALKNNNDDIHNLLWAMLYYSPGKTASDFPILSNQPKFTIFKTILSPEIINNTINNITYEDLQTKKLAVKQEDIRKNYIWNFVDYLRHIILFPISLYAFENSTAFSQFQEVKEAAKHYLKKYLNTTVDSIPTIDYAVNAQDLLNIFAVINPQQFQTFLNAIDPFQKQQLPEITLFQNFSNIVAQTTSAKKISIDVDFRRNLIAIKTISETKKMSFDMAKLKKLNNDIDNLKKCNGYCGEHYYAYYQSLLLKKFIVQYYQYHNDEASKRDQQWQTKLNQLAPEDIKDSFVYVNDFNSQMKELLATFINNNNTQQNQKKIDNIANDYNLYQTIQEFQKYFNGRSRDHAYLRDQINKILKEKIDYLKYFEASKINTICEIFQSHQNWLYNLFVGVQKQQEKLIVLTSKLQEINDVSSLLPYQLTPADYEQIFTATADIEKFVLQTLKNGKIAFSYEYGWSFILSFVAYFIVLFNIIRIIYGNNYKPYAKTFLSFVIFTLYSGFWFWHGNYDFSGFDKYCKDLKSGTKTCNNYVLIYEGNQNIKDVAKLNDLLQQQELAFANQCSYWVYTKFAVAIMYVCLLYFYFKQPKVQAQGQGNNNNGVV